MRRRVGVAGVKNSKDLKDEFKRHGGDISAKEIEELKDQLEVFRNNLEEYARQYKNVIRENPIFRTQFQRMCSTIGVDPLASNKGFWAELLGVGDFYYELGIQIIDACMATRARNGGLIDFNELKRIIERMRGKNNNQIITDDDIVRSIKTLKPLGNGFNILQIGDRRMVHSVPKELNTDQSAILVLAQKTGYITLEMIQTEFGWTSGRIEHALDNLLQDGLCWVDKQAEPEEYWVPSYFGSED